MRERHEEARRQLSPADIGAIFNKAVAAAHRSTLRTKAEQARAGKRRKPPVDRSVEQLGRSVLAWAASYGNGPAAEPTGRAAAAREAMLRDLVERCGVPAKFLRQYDVDLDRDPPLAPRPGSTGSPRPLPAELLAVVDALKSLLRVPRTVAFIGQRRRGKTAIAAGLCRWFHERGKPNVCYGTAAGYIAGIRSRVRDQSARTYKRFREARLLVLDEVQQAGSGQWVVDELGELVDHRWRNLRPTLLISNLEPDAFATFVGPQTWGRMADDHCEVYAADWPPLGPLLGDSDWGDDANAGAR